MATLSLSGAEIATFPTFLREFAVHKSEQEFRSEKTVCEYLSDLRTFFRYYIACRDDLPTDAESLAAIDISMLTLEDALSVNHEFVYKFLLYTSEGRGNGWAAKSRKLSAVKAFYKYLIKRRLMRAQDNPTTDIDSPKKRSSLPKHLTLDESLLLLNTVREDAESVTRERDFAIITLFLNCGMRLSELVGINMYDLDSELASLRVTGKGGKQRIVYLNDACRSALRKYLDVRHQYLSGGKKADALFLSNRQARISNKTVQWVVYKYLDAAGLDHRGFSVHKLRHTAATLMYQTGQVDIRVLKDVLGHEQLNTTQIYTHVSDANMEQAINANPLAAQKAPSYIPTQKKRAQNGEADE